MSYGHLRAFDKFKSRTTEYNAQHAHSINVKHTNIIQKLVSSEMLLYKMANKVRCWYH